MTHKQSVKHFFDRGFEIAIDLYKSKENMKTPLQRHISPFPNNLTVFSQLVYSSSTSEKMGVENTMMYALSSPSSQVFLLRFYFVVVVVKSAPTISLNKSLSSSLES